MCSRDCTLSPSNADINCVTYHQNWTKSIGLGERVDELCGEIVELRQANDKLRKDRDQCRRDLTEADRKASQAKHHASVTAAHSNNLEQ